MRSRTHDDVEARDRLIEADLESSRLQGSGTKEIKMQFIGIMMIMYLLGPFLVFVLTVVTVES